MAHKGNKPVHLMVDKTYFDKCFEPERRRLSNKMGITFTQKSFTAYIAASGARIKYPKIRTIRKDNRFAPKKGGLRFVI